MGAYKKIVVGTDGSKTSLLAVDRAGKVAAASGARLVIVTAFEPASKDEVLEAQDALPPGEARVHRDPQRHGERSHGLTGAVALRSPVALP